MIHLPWLRPVCAAGVLLALAACSSSGAHGTFLPVQPAASTPISDRDDTSDDFGSDARAKIKVSKKRLAFTGVLLTGTITASERGYTGVLRAKSANVKIARVKPRSVKHGAGEFTIEPIGGGTTTITIKDTKGNSAKVTVTVTAITLVLQTVPATATSVTFTTQLEPGTTYVSAGVPLGGKAMNCKVAAGKRNCTIVVTPDFGTAKKPKGTHTDIVLLNILDSSKAIVANARFFTSATAGKNVSVDVPILTFAALLPVPGYPYTLAAGPDGRVWYVDPHNGTVGAVTPAGAAATYQQGNVGASFNQSASIVPASQGKLWLTVVAYDYTVENAYVDSLTTTGTLTPYSVTKPANGCSQFNWNQPLSITAGPDGNLWFLEMIPRPNCTTLTYGVGVMSQSGTVLHDYTLPIDSNGNPIYTFAFNSQQHEIVAGSDGALYFWASKCVLAGNTCTGTTTMNAIGRITTAGAVSFTPIPFLTNCPNGYLARGGDGNVWFGAGCVPTGAPNAHTTIGRVTSSGITLFYGQNVAAMDFPLLDLDEGPDGNLYMPAQGQFGRFVTTGANVGQIDEYGTPLNQGGHFLNSMVTGPDHNLYASDCGACASRGGSFLERIALP